MQIQRIGFSQIKNRPSFMGNELRDIIGKALNFDSSEDSFVSTDTGRNPLVIDKLIINPAGEKQKSTARKEAESLAKGSTALGTGAAAGDVVKDKENDKTNNIKEAGITLPRQPHTTHNYDYRTTTEDHIKEFITLGYIKYDDDAEAQVNPIVDELEDIDEIDIFD